jgi:transcriptional regulator with XRE-family HTH domain
VEPLRPSHWWGEGRQTDELPNMIRARRRELGMTQVQLAAQVRLEEKPVSTGYIHDLERGWATPPPHVIEQLAKALELDRDLLYLAARQVPPEVAEELKRLTPEQRAAAWRVFKLAVREDSAKRQEPERGKGLPARRGGSGKD